MLLQADYSIHIKLNYIKIFMGIGIIQEPSFKNITNKVLMQKSCDILMCTIIAEIAQNLTTFQYT
jgi:hypothetical protein